MVKTRLHCIEFIRTCVRSAGSWKESTIEVRGTPLRFCIQFSRRCFAPGRPGFSREGAGTASHCVGGPRRCLRCSTIAYGGKVRRGSAPRRSRDFRRRFWKLGKAAVVDAEFFSEKAGSVASARKKPDGISESLPSHDALQIARERKRNRNGNPGRGR